MVYRVEQGEVNDSNVVGEKSPEVQYVLRNLLEERKNEYGDVIIVKSKKDGSNWKLTTCRKFFSYSHYLRLK